MRLQSGRDGRSPGYHPNLKMEAPVHPRTWRSLAGAFLAFFALAVCLQWRGHAYAVDLADNPDEAGHYVSALMARDYLLAFPWPSPIAFATRFYDYYPAVAIGHWPPMFYFVQAVWMLAFGDTIRSTLILIAVISAATATLLFGAWRSLFGGLAAAGLAVAFLIAPIVQQYSRAVMAEMLVTFFIVLATLVYARYLRTERARDAVWFGIAASAAILTKPNGLVLALVPPLAILLGRRLTLARRASFWIPAAIVAALCGPWYVLTAGLASDGWSATYSPAWLLRKPAAENAIGLVMLAGPPMFALATLGVFLTVGRTATEAVARAERRAHWAAMAALGIATWLFLSFVLPVRGMRHLVPALPPILVFAAAAAACIAHGRARTARRVTAAVLLAIAVITLGVSAVRLKAKPDMGSAAVVEDILSRADLTSAVLLVSSEWYGEGVFIAALAARDARPQHRVLRASKVLSTSTWSGSDYRLSFETPEDADRALRAAHVEVLVVDMHEAPGPHTLHHRQLLAVIEQYPNHWEPMLQKASASGRFKVFRAVRHGT